MKQNTSISLEEVIASQNTKERDYWVDKMTGSLVRSFFPYDYKKNDARNQKRTMKNLESSITGDIFTKLMEIINNSDYRLHMALTAALIVLLSKYTRNKDIIIGTPIYTPEIEGTFVNTILALRDQVVPGMNYKELLLNVRETIRGAVENQNYPIKALPYHLNLATSDMEFALFDVVLLLENIQQEKFIYPSMPNIIFSLHRKEKELNINVCYNSNLYEEITIKRIADHFINLMRQVVFNINMRISEIDILTEKEKTQVLYDFNHTEADYPKDKTIHQLFEEQAKRTPDRISVSYDVELETIRKQKDLTVSIDITYEELNKRANRLAYFLKSKGLKPDILVGLMTDRSLEMLSGILGILKSGGAYVPIDSTYPENRILYILKESGISLLLCHPENRKKLNYPGQIYPIHSIQHQFQDNENPGNVNSPGDLAYVIYTSGSTGKPKGVLTQHGNVVAYSYSSRIRFGLNESDIRALHSSFSFDQFVEEVYPIMFSGGKLVFLKKYYVQDNAKLRKILELRCITIFSTTPVILNEINKFFPPSSLKFFIVGGDILKKEYISNIIQTVPVYNFYGPTETTVCATHYRCSSVDEGSIPIGKPKENYRIYLLNDDKMPVPLKVPGEIYISGDGTARGYLNLPELTMERFINDSFFAGKRMYKSGDVGRWLPDGNIEFDGRLDQQLKIRGYRVELGEIETQIMKYPGIKDAIVVTDKNKEGEIFLVAYFVSDMIINSPVSVLSRHLGRELPDYMIPSYFIQLDNIPLTQHGKLDRGALPSPQYQKEASYIAPRDDVEKELVNIWSEVLGVEKDIIGIDTNFFELGGHSLKGTIVSLNIYKKFNVRMSLAQFFEGNTIRQIAAFIKKAVKDNFHDIEAIPEQEYYELSSAQKRLYLLYQLNENNTSYNMLSAFILEGRLDREFLENVFKKMIARHEILRTSIFMVDNEAFQKVHNNIQFEIAYFSLDSTENTEKDMQVKNILKNFVRPFNLFHAPLFCACLIKLSEEKHVLAVSMHHIISDGTSMLLFVKDFMALYTGEELPELRLKYKDFAAWQKNLVEIGLIKRQEEYWLNRFKGNLPLLNLPIDFPRTDRNNIGTYINFNIDSQTASEIKQLVLETGSTLYIFLLSVYMILLSKYSGQEDIIVGSPVAGRNHVDLINIIGLFANMLAMRSYPREESTFSKFLTEMKNIVIEAFDNQEYQFENLIWKLNIPINPTRNPLFDTVFVLQNIAVGENRKSVNKHNSSNNLKIKPYSLLQDHIQYDLLLNASEYSDTIELRLEFSTILFKESTARQMTSHYIEVLQQVLGNREILLKEIKLSHNLLATASAQLLEKDNDFRL